MCKEIGEKGKKWLNQSRVPKHLNQDESYLSIWDNHSIPCQQWMQIRNFVQF